jgi:hypothetical protein
LNGNFSLFWKAFPLCFQKIEVFSKKFWMLKIRFF